MIFKHLKVPNRQLTLFNTPSKLTQFADTTWQYGLHMKESKWWEVQICGHSSTKLLSVAIKSEPQSKNRATNTPGEPPCPTYRHDFTPLCSEWGLRGVIFTTERRVLASFCFCAKACHQCFYVLFFLECLGVHAPTVVCLTTSLAQCSLFWNTANATPNAIPRVMILSGSKIPTDQVLIEVRILAYWSQRRLLLLPKQLKALISGALDNVEAPVVYSLATYGNKTKNKRRSRSGSHLEAQSNLTTQD